MSSYLSGLGGRWISCRYASAMDLRHFQVSVESQVSQTSREGRAEGEIQLASARRDPVLQLSDGGPHQRESVYTRRANVEAGAVTTFPGLEGTYGPRWSPDGKMLAALEWEVRRRLMLYRFDTGRWTAITEERADWPAWTRDSASIVFRANETLMRVRIDGAGAEPVVAIKGAETGGFTHAIGIAPDGSPTRTLNRDSRQIYELLLQRR
jgi:hypothetical protein